MDEFLREAMRTMLQIIGDGPNWFMPGFPSATAILVMPGVHQEYRIQGGIDLWLEDQDQELWIAGTRGDPSYSREQIVRDAGVDSPNIVCGPFCRHTPDQMDWCMEMLKKNPDVEHLIMTTAAYHLPRCVLTNVAAMDKVGMRVHITPIPLFSPCGNSFSADGTEDWVSELSKIIEYQKTGHVASFEQWRNYLDWRTSLTTVL